MQYSSPETTPRGTEAILTPPPKHHLYVCPPPPRKLKRKHKTKTKTETEIETTDIPWIKAKRDCLVVTHKPVQPDKLPRLTEADNDNEAEIMMSDDYDLC